MDSASISDWIAEVRYDTLVVCDGCLRLDRAGES